MEILVFVVAIVAALLLLFGAMFAGFVYDVCASGFVATKLWLWFVVPTFHVAPIAIVPVAGLMLLVRFMGNRPEIKTNDQQKDLKSRGIEFGSVLAYPWITLFLGYLLHLFL